MISWPLLQFFAVKTLLMDLLITIRLMSVLLSTLKLNSNGDKLLFTLNSRLKDCGCSNQTPVLKLIKLTVAALFYI